MRAYNTITFCKKIFLDFFLTQLKKKKLFTGFESANNIYLQVATYIAV